MNPMPKILIFQLISMQQNDAYQWSLTPNTKTKYLSQLFSFYCTRLSEGSGISPNFSFPKIFVIFVVPIMTLG
jgi:hypothetical protein